MVGIKLLWMYVVAMVTGIIVYPFLHETGHCLTAFLLGADIVEVSIFPVPHMGVMLDNPDIWRQVAIGMSGLVFPMIVFLLKPRDLTTGAMIYTLQAVNSLAWFLSCTAIIAMDLGYQWKNEDVITIIRCIGGENALLFIVCFLACLLCIILMIRSRPINRIISFLK